MISSSFLSYIDTDLYVWMDLHSPMVNISMYIHVERVWFLRDSLMQFVCDHRASHFHALVWCQHSCSSWRFRFFHTHTQTHRHIYTVGSVSDMFYIVCLRIYTYILYGLVEFTTYLFIYAYVDFTRFVFFFFFSYSDWFGYYSATLYFYCYIYIYIHSTEHLYQFTSILLLMCVFFFFFFILFTVLQLVLSPFGWSRFQIFGSNQMYFFTFWFCLFMKQRYVALSHLVPGSTSADGPVWLWPPSSQRRVKMNWLWCRYLEERERESESEAVHWRWMKMILCTPQDCSVVLFKEWKNDIRYLTWVMHIFGERERARQRECPHEYAMFNM